jgi:hypothetical protein
MSEKQAASCKSLATSKGLGTLNLKPETFSSHLYHSLHLAETICFETIKIHPGNNWFP